MKKKRKAWLRQQMAECEEIMNKIFSAYGKEGCRGSEYQMYSDAYDEYATELEVLEE